ncbi:MAG: hypothetical protein Q8O55_02985 [Dehalococcoidales bacterium]|nr:hypothetical protein [Dehalococcoidales bacterium]
MSAGRCAFITGKERTKEIGEKEKRNDLAGIRHKAWKHDFITVSFRALACRQDRLDTESRWGGLAGFRLEFIPYLIRGRNDIFRSNSMHYACDVLMFAEPSVLLVPLRIQY